MKYRVTGADRDTGESIELTIEAPDEAAAGEVADRKGITVGAVLPVAAPAQAVAPTHSAYQRVEHGHYRGAPIVNIAPPRRGSSLGIASLILGVLAFLICWIPLVNLLGVPLSALGLVLGFIGFLVAIARNGAGIGYPIAGAAICGLALFIAISFTGAFVSSMQRMSSALVAESQTRDATNQATVAATMTTSPAAAGAPDGRAGAEDAESTPPILRPEEPIKPEADWAPADAPVRQGDVQVRIKSVKVEQVPLKDSFGGGGARSKDRLLMVQVEISNLSDTKKIDYDGWSGGPVSFGSRVRIMDNFDNRYKLVSFGFGSDVIGAVQRESVYPGRSVEDMIVFEEPIEKVEHLTLELPADAFDGTGMLRFRIPASMILR